MCWPCSWARGLPEVWLIDTMSRHWGKRIFPLLTALSLDSLMSRVGPYVQFPQPWDPPGLNLRMLRSRCLNVHCPCCARRHGFLGVVCHFWLVKSFCLLFSVDPWPGREGLDDNIPRRTKCSKVCHSLPCCGTLLTPIDRNEQLL